MSAVALHIEHGGGDRVRILAAARQVLCARCEKPIPIDTWCVRSESAWGDIGVFAHEACVERVGSEGGA